MSPKINKKIKLSEMFVLSAVMLFGFFVATAQTFAATCDSATLTGNVIVNDSPARVRFAYGVDYNTVANGQGTRTPEQIFYSNGNIEKFISGLSQNTIYYYRLEVASAYGTVATNIENFKTPQCVAPNIPTITNKYPTVVLYADKASVPIGGAFTIRWLSTGATSCNASLGSSGWAGAKSAGAGSFYVGSLTSNTVYVITCGNSLGSATDSVRMEIHRQVFNKQVSDKQAPKTITQTWIEPINKVITPKAKIFLGVSVLETGFLPTNIFGWLFLIILLLILIFLIRHLFD